MALATGSITDFEINLATGILTVVITTAILAGVRALWVLVKKVNALGDAIAPAGGQSMADGLVALRERVIRLEERVALNTRWREQQGGWDPYERPDRPHTHTHDDADRDRDREPAEGS